jgi:PAS domain S-box-containing protein
MISVRRFANLSGAEYEQLVEQAPILIWRSDTSGKCDYFNERWLAFRGRTVEQEAGNGWVEGVHPDDVQGCMDTYLSAFNQRAGFEMEYRLLRHDGSYRWIFDRGMPFYHADGEFAGYIGSCIDVTARVEAQRELQERRNAELSRLRKLLPICMMCKSVRNDQGYWQKVEEYMHDVAGTTVSHGLCPGCMQTHYPDYAV